MKNEERELEPYSTSGNIVPYCATTATINAISASRSNTLTTPPPLATLNFEYGNAAYYIDSIVLHDTLQKVL